MRFKLSLIELGLILVIFATLTALVVPTRDDDFTPRYPPASPGPGADLAGDDGVYFFGDGLGRNSRLSILPDGRYAFLEWGCTGVHDRESGYVRRIGGRFVLVPVGPSAARVERNLVVIRWDHRRYLIPVGEMAAFRQAVIEGEEPRDAARGRFFVREPMGAADGLPDAPEVVENGLCDDLLVGRVLAVSAVGLAKIGRARVDLGAEQGVREGDLLIVQRPGQAWHRRLRVVSAEESSSTADECYPGMAEHPLETGQAVIAVRMRHH